MHKLLLYLQSMQFNHLLSCESELLASIEGQENQKNELKLLHSCSLGVIMGTPDHIALTFLIFLQVVAGTNKSGSPNREVYSLL